MHRKETAKPEANQNEIVPLPSEILNEFDNLNKYVFSKAGRAAENKKNLQR